MPRHIGSTAVHSALLVVLCAAVLCCVPRELAAQQDTLRYDGIALPAEGQLFAFTTFPGELDVVYNVRFTPTERCILEGVELGFSVVKFEPESGNDTLVVWVYENSAVPPVPVNVGKTFLFDLGNQGVPAGNIVVQNPLASGARELRFLPFNPPLVFAPKRDFLIGVKLRSKQRYAIDAGLWNGFALLVRRDIADFDRYRRLMITADPAGARNLPFAGQNNASMCLRAIVRYDAGLPDTKLTGTSLVPEHAVLSIGSTYPEPVHDVCTITFSAPTSSAVRLAVYDIFGREAARLAEGQAEGDVRYARFDAAGAGLVPGLYFLRLSSDAGVVTRPIIVSR